MISPTTQVLAFQFTDKQIRTLTDSDGQPWFVAKDVCEILEHSNVSMALDRLDEDERAKFNLGRQGETNIVNESGLYSLVLGSKKPEAKAFKKWVTSEVLPAIRKTGEYKTPQSLEEQALLVITGLTARIEEMKPKAEFHDAVTESDSCFTMSQTVKILNLTLGRNNFFTLLKADKITYGENEPYQQYIEQGYFRVTIKNLENGKVKPVTLVTGKGLAWLQKKYDHIRLKEVV